MGGIGSGNYYRWNSTTKIEEVHRVDIRYLKKTDSLWPGTIGTLSWNCGGEPTGNIQFHVTEHALYLIYRMRQYAEEWFHRIA